MKYPYIQPTQQYKSLTEVFGGYNHNPRIPDSDFYSTTNTSARDYPLLAQRVKRALAVSPTAYSAMISRDVLCYVDGPTLYVNALSVTGLELSVAAGYTPKRLYSMGAYIVILPDKKWVNTADLTEYGNIENTVTLTSGDITYQPSRADGSDLESTPTASVTAPTGPADGDYWIDISAYPTVELKRYSTLSETWTAIPTTYTKIAATGIGVGFAQYDGIKIAGALSASVDPDEAAELAALNGYNFVRYRGDDYIVISGALGWVHTQTATVGAPLTISRTMPDMDYLTESENRLWGCKYGVVDNEPVNEIYACRLGDFKNWRSYAGNAMDSYAVSVGTDGKFTGAITHLGMPLFFKENCLHRVYGNYPANYQIETTTLRGVQDGSNKSMVIVNEILYYKARSEVMAYDGSLPVSVSAALGTGLYSAAVAGAVKDVMYISMKNASNTWELFTLDTAKRIWHKEDTLEVKDFCTVKDELYAATPVTVAGTPPTLVTKIYSMLGSVGTAEASAVSWVLESGVMGYELPSQKYVGRMNIRLKLASGSTFTAYIQYDSSGTWVSLGTTTGGVIVTTVNYPIIPRRCDHFQIKLAGAGDMRVYSIAKIMEDGGDGI